MIIEDEFDVFEDFDIEVEVDSEMIIEFEEDVLVVIS